MSSYSNRCAYPHCDVTGVHDGMAFCNDHDELYAKSEDNMAKQDGLAGWIAFQTGNGGFLGMSFDDLQSLLTQLGWSVEQPIVRAQNIPITKEQLEEVMSTMK